MNTLWFKAFLECTILAMLLEVVLKGNGILCGIKLIKGLS